MINLDFLKNVVVSSHSCDLTTNVTFSAKQILILGNNKCVRLNNKMSVAHLPGVSRDLALLL